MLVTEYITMGTSYYIEHQGHIEDRVPEALQGKKCVAVIFHHLPTQQDALSNDSNVIRFVLNALNAANLPRTLGGAALDRKLPPYVTVVVMLDGFVSPVTTTVLLRENIEQRDTAQIMLALPDDILNPRPVRLTEPKSAFANDLNILQDNYFILSLSENGQACDPDKASTVTRRVRPLLVVEQFKDMKRLAKKMNLPFMHIHYQAPRAGIVFNHVEPVANLTEATFKTLYHSFERVTTSLTTLFPPSGATPVTGGPELL